MLQNNKNIKLSANYHAIGSIIGKQWGIAKRYPLSLIFWLISPVLFLLPMLIFGTILVGDRYSDNLYNLAGTSDIWIFTGLGLAFMNFLFGVMWTTAYTIREEEFLGTLDSLYVTPPSKSTIIIANGIYALTFNGLTLLVQTVVLVVLLGKITIEQILLAILFTIASVLLIQGISILLSIVVLTVKQGWRIVFTIQVLLSIITPSSFPIQILPGQLKTMSLISPFTIAIEGYRNSILFGVTSNFIIDLVKLIIWAIGLFIVGVKLYAIQEKRLMKSGSLGKY